MPQPTRSCGQKDAALLILGYTSTIYGYKLTCIWEAENIPQQKAKMVVNPFSYLELVGLPHSYSPALPFQGAFTCLFFVSSTLTAITALPPVPSLFHSCHQLSLLLTQPFHIRNSSCFPYTVSGASSPGCLTLQILVIQPSVQKHQVSKGHSVDHTAIIWPVDKLWAVLSSGRCVSFLVSSTSTTEAIRRQVPTSCPQPWLHWQPDTVRPD